MNKNTLEHGKLPCSQTGTGFCPASIFTFSIVGSSRRSRWFWVAWKGEAIGQPDDSGYTQSKELAVSASLSALRLEDAKQLTSNFAEKWRGICNCQHCDSTNLKIGVGKAHHLASLKCGNCNRFLKWVSEAQLQVLREREVGQ
jgi:hypothetical protein